MSDSKQKYSDSDVGCGFFAVLAIALVVGVWALISWGLADYGNCGTIIVILLILGWLLGLGGGGGSVIWIIMGRRR